METAAILKFKQSLFHQCLFRYHVLDDTSISDPGIPGFYPQSFFEIIKLAVQKDFDVTSMTIKNWTKYLTETYITKNAADNLETFKLCRDCIRH